MALDLGMVDKKGKVDHKLLSNNLIFTGVRIGELMKNSMPKEDAKKWFGVAPPDLTLIARVRGVDWLYTYLLSFYKDESRPWGANNLLYEDVAMPNVLLPLQGVLEPEYRKQIMEENGKVAEVEYIARLQLVEEGSMHHLEFKAAVRDIVNFLAYVAEPAKFQRQRIGVWVMLFMFPFFGLTYLLKKEYWRDVEK